MSVRSSKARSSQVFTAEFDCFSKALTVDLDSSEELHEVSSGNACIIQLYPQFSANPPRLAVWCCAAMLFPKIQYRNPIYNKPCSSSSYTGLSDILQVLISAADSFRQVLDDSSRYKQYINEYVNESKRVVSAYLYFILTVCFKPNFHLDLWTHAYFNSQILDFSIIDKTCLPKSVLKTR
ncbi:unnamed protein product [Trichobilharzia regenti]|nr:unnamed protein product [Trichobilharzia regenti]